MAAPEAIRQLVERFERNREDYHSPNYNEARLRLEFLDPFFEALGWDVQNKQGNAEAYKDVISEDSLLVEASAKAPDYCFRIGGQRKFFVEAKKPAVNIRDDTSPAYQLRRYAWSAKLPLGILTDFEEFAVYDTRIKPEKDDKASTARVKFVKCTEYAERWDEIADIFSRDAILKGSFDKYAQSTKQKRGTAQVDDAFLEEIESWRDQLARNIALRNPGLSQRDLNFSVQSTIDRIVFLRICEGRGIEQYGALMALQNGKDVYPRLMKLFHDADFRYNSGIFHFERETGRDEPDKITPSLAIDDRVLKDILKRLYYPESPYEFAMIPADILGQVYERFLGKVIRLTPGGQAKVEEKPEVRKAGGVYYTPTYIVDYIVKHTVGKLVEGKKPKDVAKMRVLDPACGSGSFLLVAYQFLLDWHLEAYKVNDPEQPAKKRKAPVFQDSHGEWRLTPSERKRILLDHIYGVDIDSQAVEVTKLSLLLKVLEGEDEEAIKNQLRLLHERALPDLDGNIKCGNSLIGPDFYANTQMMLLTEDEQYRINVFDWKKEFAELFKGDNPGFDAVIGNPPYLKIEHIVDGDRNYYFRVYKSCVKRYDAFGLFIEKALLLLRNGARFGMIIPSTILNNLSFRELRRLLIEHCSIDAIVNLGGKVFAAVNNDTLLLLLTTGRNNGAKTQIYDVVKYGGGLSTAQLLGSKDLSKASPVQGYAFELRVSKSVDAMIDKMRLGGQSLRDICSVFQGFVTGGNEAYIVNLETVLKQKLERGICKPAVFGDGVSRYGIPNVASYVLYLTKDDRLRDFPNVEERLKPFRSQLQTKREVQLGRQPWYSLHWPRVEANFLRSPKILVQAIRNLALKRRVVAALDTEGLFADHTLNVIYTAQDKYDLKYVLGILNSTLINFVFSKKYVDINIKGVYLADIPIRPIDFSNPADRKRHDRMVDLVDHILDLHKKLQRVKTPHEKETIQRQIDATDRQIDLLVYDLYELTEEEIGIVEESKQ